MRTVRRDKDLTEKLARNDRVNAARGKDFKNDCLPTGKYDGRERSEHFRERLYTHEGCDSPQPLILLFVVNPLA
jgi:hypothetical protein